MNNQTKLEFRLVPTKGVASVTKVTNIEANPPDVDRMAHAGILPE